MSKKPQALLDDPERLELQAIFMRASTTVDGGWRISFDVNTTEVDQIVKLSQLKDRLLKLRIEAQ